MNKNKYYTPSVEEFHVGFRYEHYHKDCDCWLFCIYNTIYDQRGNNEIDELNIHLERVKHLDQQDIEELGWTYTGKTTELWFGIPEANVQPFISTYRSFRLSYNLTDHRLMILGYEYENYKDSTDNGGEFLFLGKIKNYNELKQVMKFLNIIK